MTNKLRRGDILELKVEKLAFGGKGVARHKGLVVFVDNGIPGQHVRARITRKKRQFAESQAIEIITQSPHYVKPFCEHFGACGGCRWQHLNYDEQLRWKRIHVVECLQHLAGVNQASVEPTRGSPRQKCYRNKMEFTFSDRRWLSPEEIADSSVQYDRSFALGLHVRGFFDRLLDVRRCYLQSPESVALLREVRYLAKMSGLPAYSIRSHRGCWRFLVIREGKNTGQNLVHLITADYPGADKAVDEISQEMHVRFPGITTFVHSINRKKAQVATGDRCRIKWGTGSIEERLGRLRFRISTHSFFQTNPLGAERLYACIGDFAECSGSETVWDLYCGTGSIALTLANRAKQVIGFELVEDAVEDAYRNAELNGIDNCRFRAGDMKDLIRSGKAVEFGGADPDVVIADPPRAGMHPQVVDALVALRPKRMIMVSCNPSSLARDLAVLQDFYHIVKVQPFDLFPHTPHIECVVKLERKNR